MSNNLIGKIALVLSIGALALFVFDKTNKKSTAYIDTKKVFNEFKLKKELLTKFESETSFGKKMLDSLAFTLQTRANELDKNPSTNKELVEQFLNDKEIYLQRLDLFNREKQELTAKYDEQILKQMNQYVSDFGKENKYAYIFGADGNGNLMYASEGEDITPKVIEYINKKYDGK